VAARFDVANFRTYAHHRVAEPIEFALGFGFGGLDHEGAGDGKTHGRRVKSIIDQAFGNVIHGDAATVLELARIDDALMGHASFGVAVQHRKMRIEPLRDVVRGENGNLAGTFQTGAAHQSNVRISDGQDARRTIGRRRHARQERRKVRFHADGARAGAASAVRYAKCLV
jgi:hypothetical protein